MDDELLNDFLAEASELIEALDADLIGLESSPNDRDVLNGVFRAFHTIKGGAGFLGLKPLVDVCHRAEDLLNLARSDVRPLGPDDIDLVLRSIDEVKRMFGELAGGGEPRPAPDTLLESLEGALDAPGAAADSDRAKTDEAARAAPAADDDPVLASFEQMLAEARAEEPADTAAATSPPVEDEFDALIDAIRAGDMDVVRALAPDAAPAPGSEGADKPVSAAVVPAGRDAGGRAAERGESRPAESAAAGEPRHPQTPTLPAASGRVPAKPAEASLRIEAGRIDDVMNLVGELVLVRNRLWSLR